MATVDSNGFKIYYEAMDGASGLSPGVWSVNAAKRHAFRIYSDYDALDETNERIVPEVLDQTFLQVNEFEDADESVFFRTRAVSDGSGGDDVELDLEDRIITMLMDQSGSMTWNDSGGLRHDIARRFVNRIDATYPGNLNYNLVKFGGDKINITLFAVLESDIVNSNDVQSVSSAFFEDDENNFAGIRVVRREDDYPSHALDGQIITEGFFSKAFSGNLETDSRYYYTVFTFDKNSHFSSGVNISAKPKERVVPRGLATVSSEVLIGSGVVRDDNTIALWHFDESVGNKVYDFSDSKLNLTSSSTDPVWLDAEDVPIGLSGMRLNGSSDSLMTESTTGLSLTDKMTLMCWIYPFDFDTERTILARQSTISTNYILNVNTAGALTLSIDGTNFASSSPAVLTANAWNHVAVTIDLTANQAQFYTQGILKDAVSLVGSTTSTEMAFDVGEDRRGIYSNFFGKINDISVHNIARPAAYILDNSTPPEVTEAAIGEPVSEPDTDNNDRLVLIQWDVPSDYNYQNGNVLIVRDDFKVPSWERDGTEISRISASPGSFTITDTDDFVLGSTVNYRVFTQNALGNYSLIDDSPKISLTIPESQREEPLEPLFQPLSPVISPTAINGNKKVYLKWTNPVADDRVKRVRIYYSQKGYPVVGDKKTSDSEMIYEGSSSVSGFVHRHIENNVSAFYTLATVDRVGRISNTVNISGLPSADESDIGIPLLDVENITYEIVDNESISISWDNPVEFTSDVEGYFDDRAYIYAAITDEFGSPISDSTRVSLKTKASVGVESLADNVFGGSDVERASDISDYYIFGQTKVAPGIIRGTIRATDDLSLLSALSSLNFEVSIFANIPDSESNASSTGEYTRNLFEFNSTPIQIKLNNPFVMEIKNRDERKVIEECKEDFSNSEFSSALEDIIGSKEIKLDGAYIRSNNDFVARVYLSYKGGPISEGNSINVSVWDATTDVCSEDFEPVRIRGSATVLPPATTLDVTTELQEVLENGQATGRFKEVSYVDVPLTVPRFFQGALLFVRSEVNGYTSIKDFYLYFQTILKLEISARAPSADGIDVAEQKMTSWLIDPDDPDNERAYTKIPDLTPVRWKLTKKEFGKNRPFYSTDNVPAQSGVFSYIRDGVAQNVFFGPASGVQWHVIKLADGNPLIVGERYNVSARVIYDGLEGFVNQNVEIYPINTEKDQFDNAFLMEMPSHQNILWADGEDYVELVISKDPYNPSSKSRYAECFRSCVLSNGGDIVPLQTGQFVSLTSSDIVEMVWGDVTASVDPYTGEPSLEMGVNSGQEFGSAQVELSEEDGTSVYFRINAFFPPAECETERIANECSCFGATNRKSPSCEEYVVTGSTTIQFNGEPRTLAGGGDISTGLPPTILHPKEPLDIKVVDIRADGVPSDTIVVDGKTVNSVIVEVTFSGRPVPNGTTVFLENVVNTLGGRSKISYAPRVIKTEKKIDTLIDSVNVRSYAKLDLDPISSEDGLFEAIIFKTTYDKSGEVDREKQVCTVFQWDPNDNEEDLGRDIFNASLYRYTLDPTFISAQDEYGNLSYSVPPGYPIDSSSPPALNTDPNNPILLSDNVWTKLEDMNHGRGALTVESNFDMFADLIRSLGPAHYFRFNEVMGPWAKDEITGKYAEYINDPVLYAKGGLDNSHSTAVITGTTDLHHVVFPASEHSIDLSENFTVVTYAKMDSHVNSDVLIAQRGIVPVFGRTGTYQSLVGNIVDSGAIYNLGTYDLVVVTFNAATLELKQYINGSLSNTETATIAPATQSTLDIHMGLFYTLNAMTRFNGCIAEIAIFDKILSLADVQRLHASTQLSGKLYAIGGIDSKTISKFAEEYDLNTDTWIDVNVMSVPRMAMQSVVVNGKIFCMGGIGADGTGALSVSNACEVYDMLTGIWERVSDMPSIDDGTVDGISYGVALGVAEHVRQGGSNLIYILSGVIAVDANGLPETYNDRVIIYNIDNDTWSVTDAFTEGSFEIYKRLSPSSMIDDDGTIVVTNGAITEGDSPTGRLKFVNDSYAFDPSANTISINDNEFSVLPSARYKAASVTDGFDHYYIGGTTSKSTTTKDFYRVGSDDAPFSLTELTNLPISLTHSSASICTSDISTYNNVKNMFVSGGFQSGRGDGFVQIQTVFSPAKVRLDGRRTVGIGVTLVTDNGQAPSSSVNLRIRGYLKFSDKAEADTNALQTDESQRNASKVISDEVSIYPVVFSSSNVFTDSSGKANITLLPRSDDFIENAETIAERAGIENLEDLVDQSQVSGDNTIIINSGSVRNPYSIAVEITVVDDFYFGQTIEQVTRSRASQEEEEFSLEEAFGETPVEVVENEPEEETDPCSPIEEEGGTVGTTDTGSTTAPGDTTEIDQEELCKDGVAIDVTTSWQSVSRGTEIDISAINSSQGTVKDTSADGDDSTVGKSGVAGQGGTVISSTYGTSSYGGGVLQKQLNAFPTFSIVPVPFDQHNSPEIVYFSDIEWIPIINIVVGGNSGDADTMLRRLENLRNEIPFGASAIFDALVAAAQLLSDNDVDGIKKSIYLFTDNESNMSFSTLSETTDDINAIDGEQETPVVVGNFAVVDPITISAKANTTDTDDLNKLSQDTGGQSISVLSDDFENELVQIFAGEAVGSLGYGTYTFVLDIGSIVDIRSIASIFELYSNTNGSWSIEISDDGFTYAKIDEKYSANNTVAFSNLKGRYVKFSITLTTGFTAINDVAYEEIALPAPPKLLHIDMVYEQENDVFLYLNEEETAAVPQQIVGAIDALQADRNDIEIGVGLGRNVNWLDFYNNARPVVKQNGKTFVPLRSRETEEDIPFEPLTKIDGYAFKTHFGRWEPSSEVTVIDSSGDIVDSSEYEAYPRDGLIVFSYRRSGSFKIKIDHNNKFVLGVKMTTRSNISPMEIYGLGYMYNTNVNLLPPVEKVPPQARNMVLLPDEPTVYSPIEASYEFYDRNADAEDTEQTEIRWYINGVRIKYLDNVTKWNDITNPEDPLFFHAFSFSLSSLAEGETAIGKAREKGESILKSGDLLYFTVKPSDGELFGSIVTSEIKIVGEDKPTLTNLTIKGQTATGSASSDVRSSTLAVVDFSLLGDSDVNDSEIIWYVNGEEFKRGSISDEPEAVEEGETPTAADRLIPGEVNPSSETGDLSDIALRIDNELQVTVIPKTGGATGDAIESDIVIVKNGLPVITSAAIGPSQPKSSQNLVLTYSFVDIDVAYGDNTQSDQTMIKWFYKSALTRNNWVEVPEFENATEVPSTATAKGQTWTAVVTPFDGLDTGSDFTTNEVTIS